MNTMEKYVTSLETSIKLRDIGVPQVSEWYWVNIDRDNYKIMTKSEFKEYKNYRTSMTIIGSAFHVGELGESLPIDYFTYQNSKGEWFYTKINYRNYGELTIGEMKLEDLGSESIEAEARGKMLLYLVQNKLITFPSGERGRKYEN